jgi:hypothetical protein
MALGITPRQNRVSNARPLKQRPHTPPGQRSVILDEFIALIGYDRKYATRLLLGPIRPPAPIRRPRAAHHGVEVQEALANAWLGANAIFAKRLVPFLAELIPTLEGKLEPRSLRVLESSVPRAMTDATPGPETDPYR